MPSTFFGLSIGTSGLYAYQAAMRTTGHNVANAGTPGYSRQHVVRSASNAISVSSKYGMMGNGVDATGILQQRNEYYDIKYWNNNSVSGEYTAKSYYMLSAENYFSEVNSDGTTATFDEFFGALNSLETSLGDPTKRKQAVVLGQNYTEYINYLADGMKTLQKEANFEIKVTADRVNGIAQEVASLTKQINTIEMSGSKANDLRDYRALLIDELSELANVKVSETSGGESAATKYEVRIDGMLLVDTYEYNTLECTPRKSAVNQNDAEGLFDIKWSNGQNFSAGSRNLGGKLQALFEFRDGNNLENLKGTANGTAGGSTITMTGTSCDDINKLNIAAADGMVTIDGKQYDYSSFEVDIDANGKYTYTFHLKNALTSNITDASGKVGEGVDYKGIPYYMAQMNEFTRTIASAFNTLHNQGQDMDSGHGLDFFNGTDGTTGKNYILSETLTHFSSVPDIDDPADLKSYYLLTADNLCITQAILDDPRKLALAAYPKDGTGADEDGENVGIENGEILKKLMELKEDETLFKQGTASSFLRSFTAEIGINTKKAADFSKNQGNILKAINTQRMSVSGVDEDEEALDMVKFKEAYDLSAKFIQVMNEIYNKLINDMV